MNVRRPTDSDFDAVRALMLAIDLADTGEPDFGEVELRAWWKELDLERNAWLVELDGRLAAYADFEERSGGRLMGDGYVHPELRGRGVGSEIVRLLEARAHEAAEQLEGRVYLQNATVSQADEFYARRGYAPVRRFRRMAIDLEQPPEVPLLPDVELRAPRPGEERVVHAVLDEAFSGHWEHRPQTFEEFSKRTSARENYDPSLYVVAERGGELVGVSLNWWKDVGDAGWISALGVVPAARGRGIGAALVLASFAELFRRGERRVALGVDAQNESGALRLYERLGMRGLWDALVWEKELRPGA